MSEALLFSIGSVIFFAVFAAALSFAYMTGDRADRVELESGDGTVAARLVGRTES